MRIDHSFPSTEPRTKRAVEARERRARPMAALSIRGSVLAVASRASAAESVSVFPMQPRRVQIPSRKSEMLCPVKDMSSKTADVPSPSGHCVLIPIQIDAG